MNKKFLSAILFGALMVTSTGTFVSCKDYDDDIKDLQGQINSNKDAIAALQKLVGEGKWVTNITPVANGFTVTMSDGTSQTVTSVKGEDGKDGTEWTIGEDGFWYKDGEKTASQAVAKNGATAPSPKINADGFWVVYELNAATGEFVEKVTEVSAQGTGAYVVAKDGVYVLHIADETGKFQDVTLPATSDSFVAEAPFSDIRVCFEAAKWNPTTTNTIYQQLAKAFPEIKEIAKNTLLKQGGKLPVLVTPSAVELTDKMNFSLQNVKGEKSEATISSPTKGLPANTSIENDYILVYNSSTTQYERWMVGQYMQTRSTDSSDCFWTLEVEPAKNKQGTAYETISEKQSLVIENEKGTVVKTAFAYTVNSISNSDVTIGTGSNTVDYASEIDLFAQDKNGNVVFTINHGYNNYYILEVTDPATVEKYDISIEGSTLKIGNMPTDKNNITVPVKLTALGLNGSVVTKTQTLYVNREIEASGTLADKTVTLSTSSSSQLVLWNISDFKFTAVQKQQFVGAYKVITVTYYDENGDEQTAMTYNNSAINCYKEDGKTSTSVYTEAAKFGFNLLNSSLAPRDYKVRLDVSSNGSNILAAEATMTVKNPTVSDIFKLASAYTENGVLQITGDFSTSMITYGLENGVVAPSYATLISTGKPQFIDLDHAAWAESLGSATDMGAVDWVAADGKTLSVNKYVASADANKKQLYVERNIRAVYTLFGNSENVVNYDFKVIVKSAVYSSDASKVIALDKTKLQAEFDDADGVNIKDGITATYAAGKNKGKEYSLFDGKATDKKTTYQIYNAPKTNTSSDTYATYVLNSNGLMVQIDLNDMATFGFSADVILGAQNDDAKKYYVLNAVDATQTAYKDYDGVKTWNGIWSTVSKYYDSVTGDDGKTGYKRNTTKVADSDAAIFNLFTKYAAKITFDTTVKTTSVPASAKAAEIASTTIEWVNANEAEKYVDITNSSIADGLIVAKALDDIKEDLVNGKATVNVKLTVTDKWGMKMTRTIEVTLVAPED